MAQPGVVPTGQEVFPGRYGALGVNVTIPIFNGGLYKARTSEARLKAQAATRTSTTWRTAITRDVRVAYPECNHGYDRLGLTAQLLDQAKLALDLAQSRYDLGLGSIVELSQAQLNLTSRADRQFQRALRIPDATVRGGIPDRRPALGGNLGCLISSLYASRCRCGRPS